MPQRVEIHREEDEGKKPQLTPIGARRGILGWAVFGVIGLAVLIYVISLIVGMIGTSRQAGLVFRELHQEAPGAQGIQSEIRVFGAALTRGQLRVLVGGRSLDYAKLTPEQQGLFIAIHPLPEAGAPRLTPYQVRLDRVGTGPYELRLIWQAPGTSEAVVRSITLR